MKRFPSSHGARVVFDPVRSKTPLPRSRVTPKSGPVPRESPASTPAPARKPSPSYAEIDVVEANLTNDPRHDPPE
jgi:hypothetical protein